MATLLYVILKLANVVNEENDWVNICHLFALDSISFILLLHLWHRRKS